MRVRLVGLVALMGLVLASCGGASPEAGGPSEGIQVHGDWTIDIYNEDGTLDRHVEFKNALTTEGGAGLVGILTRQWNVGGWFVILDHPDEALRPCDDAATAFHCLSITDDSRLSDSNTSKNLILTADIDRLILNGSIEASRDGQIAVVTTQFTMCDPPAVFPCDGFRPTVTEKTLADPIEVSDGQVVQVEVVISFTSG